MTPIEKILATIERLTDEFDLNDALSIVIGVFLGLTIAFAKQSGIDTTKPITIDGGTGHDITIHPPKDSK